MMRSSHRWEDVGHGMHQSLALGKAGKINEVKMSLGGGFNLTNEEMIQWFQLSLGIFHNYL